MPVPDRHQDESTIEIDKDKYVLWLQAREAVKAWTAEADRLAKELQASLYGFSAGTVDGQKVVSYRPKDQYAVKRLIQDYPDLTKHYITPVSVPTMDITSFAAAHPDIAEKYRVREFRGLE